MTKQEFDAQFPIGKIKVNCRTIEEDRILYNYVQWLGVEDSIFEWYEEFPLVGTSASGSINRWREGAAYNTRVIEFSDWYNLIFGNQDEDIADLEEIL